MTSGIVPMARQIKLGCDKKQAQQEAQ